MQLHARAPGSLQVGKCIQAATLLPVRCTLATSHCVGMRERAHSVCIRATPEVSEPMSEDVPAQVPQQLLGDHNSGKTGNKVVCVGEALYGACVREESKVRRRLALLVKLISRPATASNVESLCSNTVSRLSSLFISCCSCVIGGKSVAQPHPGPTGMIHICVTLCIPLQTCATIDQRSRIAHTFYSAQTQSFISPYFAFTQI